MCGNGIRCVAKYVYDYGLTDKTRISVETLGGIKYLDLTLENGKVTLRESGYGTAKTQPRKNSCHSGREQVIDEPILVDGEGYRMTCVPWEIPMQSFLWMRT